MSDNAPRRVPTKPAALSEVAGHLLSYLAGLPIEELIQFCGLREEKMTVAEIKRMEWASEDVKSRLGKLVKEDD